MIGFWLDYVGVATFAASSAGVCHRERLDLTATLLVACTAALGGGTVRDLLLRQPIFWIVDTAYVLSCLAAATAVWAIGLGRRSGLAVALLEAVGIGSFTVVGVDKALGAGTSNVAAIILGMLTATFGGIVSDGLASRPSVLTRKDIYVTAALVSAIVYDVMLLSAVGARTAVLLGAGSGIVLRLAALYFALKMPAPKSASS